MVLLKLQLGVVFKVNVLEPTVVGVPVAVSTIVRLPVTANVPLAAKVTPFVVLEILYVPAVVTVAVMVWVTADTAVPKYNVPVEAVLQEYTETSAVPLDDGLTRVVRIKKQLGAVFRVNVLSPIAIGVPEAVSTIF